MSKTYGPSSLADLKAKAAERQIYFHGIESYNLKSLCGFGLAEHLQWRRNILVLKSAQKKDSRKFSVKSKVKNVSNVYIVVLH